MGKVCLNPDCEKPIPDDHNYCDEICLRWHIKIKKPHSSFGFDLKPNPDSRYQIEAVISGAKHMNPNCLVCQKPIDDIEENYFLYHGGRFCNINCYREYKKTEKIELAQDLPFMRYVQQQQNEVLVYA